LRTIGLVGCALLVAAAAFAPAAMLAYARQPMPGETGAPKPVIRGELSAKLRLKLAARGTFGQNADINVPATNSADGGWLVGWPQAVVTGIFGLLAAGGVIWLWRLPAGPAPDPSAELVMAGALVLCAFPVLVLERVYANTDARSLPEAPQLQWLLRVPMAALL